MQSFYFRDDNFLLNNLDVLSRRTAPNCQNQYHHVHWVQTSPSRNQNHALFSKLPFPPPSAWLSATWNCKHSKTAQTAQTAQLFWSWLSSLRGGRSLAPLPTSCWSSEWRYISIVPTEAIFRAPSFEGRLKWTRAPMKCRELLVLFSPGDRWLSWKHGVSGQGTTVETPNSS